jgi:hypothetical protein
MSHHRLLAPISIAAAITAALVPTDAAAADDHKTYHAAFCHSNDGVESNWNRSEYRITRKGGPSPGTLLCPIVHDRFEADCGWTGCVAGLVVDVKVQDNHPWQDVRCTLSARNASGSAYWYSTAATEGSSTTLKTLSLAGLPKWGLSDTYVLSCQVPTNDSYGYAKIFGYAVRE